MADTRRLRKGYVMVGMAVPEEIAQVIRVRAVMARMSIGDYVASLVQGAPERPARRSLPELLEGTEGLRFGEGGEVTPKPSRKGAKRPQEASEDLAALWSTLEALRQAQGLTDKVLADAFHIDKANLPQWRKKGAVPASKAEAVRRFLADQA